MASSEEARVMTGQSKRVVATLALVAWTLAAPMVGNAKGFKGLWVAVGPMSVPRYQPAATRLEDGRVLVAGACATQDRFSSDLYDPATRVFIPTGDTNFERCGFTLTLLRDGTVLAPAGGSSFCECYLRSAEIYHPDSGVWTLTGRLHDKRAGYASALLPDGTVLVAGGTNTGGV